MRPNEILGSLPRLLTAATVALATPSAGAQDTAGYKWRPTTAPEARRTDDVFFINPDTGWAVNSNGQIIHTKNGGDTWNEQKVVPAPAYLRCVGFVDADRGWVGSIQRLGGTDLRNRLLKTDNGGADWEQVTNLPATAPVGICGLSVVNRSVIYASGTNDPINPTAVVKTTDGGETWTAIDMERHADLLVDIFFPTPDRGWVVGGRGDTSTSDRARVKPVVLYTEDGGRTWVDRVSDIRDQFPEGEWGWKIQFLDETHGFISLEAFDHGAILTTRDGGKTWVRKVINDKQPNGQANANLEGIGFVTPERGWVGGWGNRAFTGGFSSVTTDGGENWEAANEIGSFINRFRFFFKPELLGYSSGRTVYKYSKEPVRAVAEVAADSSRRLLKSRDAVAYAGPVEFSYRVPEGARRVTIDVWDPFGFYLARAVEEADPRPGERTTRWDRKDQGGKPVPKGIVIYRLTVDDRVESGSAELK